MSSSSLLSNEYKNRVKYNRAQILNAKIDNLNVNELTVNNLNENNENNNLDIPFVFEKLRISNGTINNNEITFNISDLVLYIWSDRSLNPEQNTSYNNKYVGENAFYYLQLGFNGQFFGNYSYNINNPNVNITIEDEDYFMILNNYFRENDIITLYLNSQNLNLPNGNFNKIFVNIDNLPLLNFNEVENDNDNDNENIRKFISSDNNVTLYIYRELNRIPSLSGDEITAKIINLKWIQDNTNTIDLSSAKVETVEAIINRMYENLPIHIVNNNVIYTQVPNNKIFNSISGSINMTGIFPIGKDIYNFHFFAWGLYFIVTNKYYRIRLGKNNQFDIVDQILCTLEINNKTFRINISRQNIDNYTNFVVNNDEVFNYLLEIITEMNRGYNLLNPFANFSLKTNFNQIIRDNFG